MNERVIVMGSHNRSVRSLYKWLAKVTGVDACWIENIDEHKFPVWGIIKRITGNRFLVQSRRLAAASILGASLCLLSPSANAQSTVEASTFRGQNGFTLTGSSYADNLGGSIAIGDINGDGFEDLVVGAAGAGGPANTNNSPGQIAVLFGTSSGFNSSITLTSLDGVNGFALYGTSNGAQNGTAVASDDINGDGFDDIIIGGQRNTVHVVFGKSSAFSSLIQISDIADGTNGFVLVGENGSNTGRSLATGNITGDTAADMLIGAPRTSPNGVDEAGQTYVVFGNATFPDTLQLSSLEANNSGFVILGNEYKGAAGSSLASGNINGDGFEDVLIGAPNRYGDSYIWYGDVYVVFGQSDTFADSLNVSNLDGSNGFRFRGTAAQNYFGNSIGSGDVNGDGYDDLFVNTNGYGRDYTSTFNPTYYGENYVLFGKSDAFSPVVDDSSLDGTNGFFFDGINDGDRTGEGFASVDLNGDGMDELITGSSYAYSRVGTVYVIFGFDDTSVSEFQLSSLDGDNGFIIKGSERIGGSFAAGDLDGDGFYEIISGNNDAHATGVIIPSSIGREGVAEVFFNTINQTISGGENYRLLSAPTHGKIFDELLGTLWTQGSTGSDNPDGNDTAWMWDSNTQAWTALSNQSTDSLAAGHGFLSYIFSDDNFGGAGDSGFPKRVSVSQFAGNGTFNSGTINPISGLGDGDFFLAGNPFGFTIDWDSTAVSKTNLSNVIYVYDAADSVWHSWNGTTGDANEGEIAPFQGFFVQGMGGSGSLSMGEGAISDSAGIFLKQVPTEPKILKIQAEAGGFTANAWLSFQQGGEIGRDAFDGLYLKPFTSSYLQLATVIDNQDILQINALPADQSEELQIPLSMSGTIEAETASLSFEGLEDFEEWSIIIQDLQTDQEYQVYPDQPLELDIQRVNEKAMDASPAVPNPVAAKSKPDGHRFQVVFIPHTQVNNELEDVLPDALELQQNYPNPFNPVTTINYQVPRLSRVRLEVFDLMGRKVATLVNSEQQQPGRYVVRFDASQLASGTYIYRLTAGSTSLIKKLTLIK